MLAVPDHQKDIIDKAVTALQGLVLHRVLAEFEPTIDSFRCRPAQVGAITRAIHQTQHDGFKKFASPKGRHDFLCAAFRHLAQLEDREELLVGLGRRHGPHHNSLSRVEFLWHGVGTRDSVALTPVLRQAIESQVGSVERGQAIVIHNHPPNDIKGLISMFFGWKPLPSSRDRDLATEYNVRQLIRFLQSGWEGSLLWYLVDEGRLSEFYLPNPERIISTLLSWLNREDGCRAKTG